MNKLIIRYTQFAYKVNTYILRHVSTSIIVLNSILVLINAILFYYLVPFLLNFAPDFKKYNKIYTISYLYQYIFATLFALVITCTLLGFSMKGISEWEKLLDSNSDEDAAKLRIIRRKCINLPYMIYVIPILAVFIGLTVVSAMYALQYKHSLSMVVRLTIIVITFVTLSSTISFISSKQFFTEILRRTYRGEGLEGNRISMLSKQLIQLLPMLTVAILFTSLLGYSRVVNERSRLIFNSYSDKLTYNLYALNRVKDARWLLKMMESINIDNTKICEFVISPDRNIITSNGVIIEDYFKNYLFSIAGSHKGRVYDDTGFINGAVIYINTPQGVWTAGVEYSIISNKEIMIFAISFIIMLIMNILIFLYFSRTLSDMIASVAHNLSDIAERWDVKSKKKIPVTSNDEVADLVIAFNKIRDCEFEYDQLKSEFIANVSHELKAPINIIYNTIELFSIYNQSKSDLESSSKINSLTSSMKRNCYKLLRLVNNLIDSTKIDANFYKINLQDCDLIDILKETTASVTAYVRNKNINLDFHADAKELIVACDIDAIERIMLNLLSNAIKFTEPGGNISVNVALKEDQVEIKIKDTGIGIPSDKINTVFERFRQVDNICIRKHEGSGIGLSIVKSLVHMHNGIITVSSELKKGTEFTILLPVRLVNSSKIIIPATKRLNGIEKTDIELSDVC